MTGYVIAALALAAFGAAARVIARLRAELSAARIEAAALHRLWQRAKAMGGAAKVKPPRGG